MASKFQHLRGIILEGISSAGKTSTLNSLKIRHGTSSERSIIVLGEHYSQIRHKQNSAIKISSVVEHKKLLNDNLKLLTNLGNWGNYLGDYKRTARGIFFVFERFHLNHAQFFPKSDISKIEKELLKCNARTLLLTVSPGELHNRIKSRNPTLNKQELTVKTEAFLNKQQSLIELSTQSKIPTLILNTDKKDWMLYAESILQLCE